MMLIPGAVTGAGSVSIFVVGGMVASILTIMGMSKVKTTAFLFIFAILSAAAPPINLWTMLMTAQANMPYVGFELLLLLPILVVSAFTIIFLGRGTKQLDKEAVLKTLPEVSDKFQGFGGWVRILLPFVVLIALICITLFAPFAMPSLGLPLFFVICLVVVFFTSPVRFNLKKMYSVTNDTMEQVFSLVATVLSVGVLQNAMAASGVKGLIGTTFVLLPFVWIYITILIIGPFSQGCMSYGSAVVIGTPLIFMFNTAGMNTTVVCAALSLIFPIGDCLPPSRIVGRITVETSGYEGSYSSFLKQIAIPCLLLGIIAVVMLAQPSWFRFLI